MPVTIKTANMKYKNNQGEYVGINAVAETKTAEQVAAIQSAGTQALNDINTRKTQIDSILPSDYVELNEKIDNIIDDTAGEGDYNKAWSADKTYININDLKSALINYEPSVAAKLGELNVSVKKINGGNDKDETLYSLFESIEEEHLDELMDQSGEYLEFPILKLKELKDVIDLLKNYYDKISIHQIISGKIDPIAAELGKLNVLALEKSLFDIDSLFEVIYKTLDDYNGDPLLDEKGELLLGPCLKVKDENSFIPEDYVYNSGTSGYYQYLAVPILYLYGDTSKMSKDKKVKLTAEFKDIKMGCSCKWQGSSSLAYPKKNYTVTFDFPVKIVDDWGQKRKYVLKSEFLDNTHTRNTVSARLWAEIVRDREQINSSTTLDDQNGVPFTLQNGTSNFDIIDSDILSSPGAGCNDGFHVMLIINNKYFGLYTMGIPKDDWMFGMDNGRQNCCVLNAEHNIDATKFRATTSAEEIENETTFALEYASDDMSIDRITASVNQMLNSVMIATGSNYRTTIEQYFDVDNAIDYLIFSLMLGNWDGISHNYNLVTYDGIKWRFSAYDLDNTFGLEDLSNWTFNKPYDNPTEIKPNLPFPLNDNRLLYLVQQFDKTAFKERYTYLRRNILSEYNIFTNFYNFISCVSKRILAEEYNIWPTTPRSGAQYIDVILNYYRLRCMYMDSVVLNL